MIDYLLTQSCVDCRESDIVVLEFDHVRGRKRGDVSKMLLTGFSWKSILDEIAKCDVVCANCHRRRTSKRARSYRFVAIQGR